MAGKMLVERTIFCLWRAGREALPRRGPDRRKRMWDGLRQAGPGQGKGAREPCCRERIGNPRQEGGGREAEGQMQSLGLFQGRVAAKAGQWRLPGRGGRCADSRKGIRGPETSLPRRSRRAGWSGSLRTGQTFRMGPQAAPASDVNSPAGIGSDAGGAIRSVIRYCGVSEGAQSGARSSKAV